MVGNTLQYHESHEWFRALPRNAMECEIFHYWHPEGRRYAIHNVTALG
jgi:hypothetical protein